MHMKDGENGDDLAFHHKEDAVREVAHERPPSAFFNCRKLKRILNESREDPVDLLLETEAEIGALALVSKRRLKNLEFGLGRDNEPPHSACSAESG